MDFYICLGGYLYWPFLPYFPMQIGSLCMDIIDGELQRTDQYRDQLTKRKKGADGMADPAKLQQDYERNLKKYQAVVAKQDQVCLVRVLIRCNLCCCFTERK